MKRTTSYLLFGIFGMAFFILMLNWVKPELIYHFQQLGFSTSKSFLSEMAAYPGGLAEYFSIFLFQYSYTSFSGALVNALIVLFILILTGFVLKKQKSAIDGLLLFVPATLTGILMVEYGLHPVFPLLVALSILFLLIFSTIFSGKARVGIKLLLIILLFSVFFFIAGGFAFLVLTLSSFIIVLFRIKEKNTLPVLILIVVLAFLIPKIAPLFFFITENDAFVRLVPYFCNYKPGYLLYAALFSLPAVVLLQTLFNSKQNAEDKKISFFKSQVFNGFLSVLMIVALITGMKSHIDNGKMIKLQVDKFAHNRDWESLLKYVEGNSCEDRIIQFQINRALYFTGNLTDKLFEYPQLWGVDGLFLTRHFSDEMLLPSTELLFDLAYVNEAIHYANEALAQNEHSPLLIEQLILANIASDKLRSAQMYVNVLKEYPIFEQEAADYEKYLSGQGYPGIDDLMVQKRELMPETDFKVNRQNPSSDLLNILIDRPQNKMAYEYLMACFLLDNDLASFVKYYSIGRKFNYGKVPSVFQQALVLYSYELSRIGKSIGNLRYDKEVVNQFNEYLAILSENNGNMEAAMPKLNEKFGATYWYYIHYNSPVTTKKTVKYEK